MKRETNRIVACLLAVLMVITMLPETVFAAESTVVISTADQLLAFADEVNGGDTYAGKTVQLTEDINLGGETSPWTPIGSFGGTFDGAGHVISGMYINGAESNQALFAKVSNDAVIKNLIVQGDIISSGGTLAGIVAENNGTIENCASSVNITATGGNFVHFCGGITADNSGTVTSCCFTGIIAKDGGSAIGGLVGRNFSGTVTDCYNTGSVSSSAGSHVGGVIGQSRGSTTVRNLYNVGKIAGQTNVGAVIGQDQNSSGTSNLYYLAGSAEYGVGESKDTTGCLSESDMKNGTLLSKLGAAFQSDEDGINSGYPVLSWQKVVPDVIIGTYEQLLVFAEAVNGGNSYAGKRIKLDVNIDLGGKNNPWTPIGSTSAPFEGIFDGGYHVISGLYIVSGSNVGLFGNVKDGTVKNLVVDGSVTGSQNVGGVAGSLNGGTAENCGNRATVAGSNAVGGVAGGLNGGCTVKSCFNTGTVSGTTGYIGGVAGQGANNCTVTDCYNTGAVSGPATVGGVLGGHKAYSTKAENCYNSGAVTGTGTDNNIGPVVGKTRGDVTNCYYLENSANYNSNNYGTSFTGKLAASQLGGAFADGDVYPVLTWEEKIDTTEPVLPGFVESTERSKELADLIRAAVNSAKSHNGVGSGTLLGNDKFKSGASSTGTDWMALAMGRFGYYDVHGEYRHLIDDGSGYADYLDAMKAYIEKTYAEQNGILNSAKATEWHRAVLAIMALGGDPTHFGVYNGKPIDLIADGSYNCVISGGPGKQGINGWIFGLIAMDTGMFEVPEDAQYSREDFITEILKLQLSDGVGGNTYGGWVLSGAYGAKSDIDITAMAIQALAPYYNNNTVYTYTNTGSKEQRSVTVRQCVDEALDVLSSRMDRNGGFSSWGSANVEGISQVLVALCSLGIDPATDARFVTSSGKTLLDGLMQFRLTDGGFCHILGSEWNYMANDQATYALASYWRLENGMRALYDMRGNFTEEQRSAIDAAVTAIDGLPDPSDENYKAKIKEALNVFQEVPAGERRYVGNYSSLAAALDLIGGEDKLDTLDHYVVRIRVSKQPNKQKYFEGDLFDPSGMEVTAAFSDGTEQTVSGYRCAPSSALTLDDKEITVIYGVLKTTVSITVEEKLPWNGSGTAEDPYLIETPDDLVILDDYVRNKENSGTSVKGLDTRGMYFKMTRDINLANVQYWHAIGADHSYQSLGFCGHFDGDGHQIWNLNTEPGYSVSGLFGNLGDGAVIENVGIASGNIGGDNTMCTNHGGIAAKAIGNATIRNCWNYASVTGGFGVGGILGCIVSPVAGRTPITVTIESCYNAGKITTSNDGGGIVGRVGEGNATDKKCRTVIKNCYNVGEITGSGTFGNGGIVGTVRYCSSETVTELENCYNAGKVNGKVSGAVIGSVPLSKAKLENVYYLTGICAQEVGVYQDEGKDCEHTIEGTAQVKSADEMRTDDFVTALGDAFAKDADSINAGYPILKGQQALGEEPPVRAGLEIGTEDELMDFAERVNNGENFANRTVALTANLDLSYVLWTPIGLSEKLAFAGTFDGQGFCIDNLYSSLGGLFGYAADSAVIRNVGVASGEIGREAGYSSFFGGILGWSNGADVINCWNGTDIYCGSYSGGVVGTVRGGESVISGCFNCGNVTGPESSTHLGGIVGHLDTGHPVTVEDCYNLGDIAGGYSVGGIVGALQDGPHTVTRCYNAGAVQAITVNPNMSGRAGAIVGDSTRTENTVEDCYYLDGSCDEGGINKDAGIRDTTVPLDDVKMKDGTLLSALGDAFKADPYALVSGGYPLLIWQKTEEAGAVDEVISLIDAIGEVTIDREDAIRAAREAYDALDDEALQALVTNYETLTKAEEKLQALKDAAEPSDPDDPSNPSDPSKPTDLSDPSKPTDPSDPSDPSKPADPSDPSDPGASSPSSPSDPSGSGNPSGDSSSPQTGDTTPLPFYLFLMLVSGLAVTVLSVSGKKQIKR